MRRKRIDWHRFAQDCVHKRKGFEYTQEMVAAELNLSRASIARAELGVSIGTDIFVVLCKFLVDTDPRLYLK